MSAYTPGPWLIGDDLERAAPAFYSICSKPNAVEVARCEELADAQLVAAAPELLEALQTLCDDVQARAYSLDESTIAAMLAARAAIAKALQP